METNLVTITSRSAPARTPAPKGKILLVKPPYFTPWTPPLGIAILKSFMAEHGYSTTCYDFNVDPELWGMHHKYFGALQALEDVSINDGYSKLWWILNAHMLAYANGADPAKCARVLEQITPLYGIRCDAGVVGALLPLVEGFFRRLDELIDGLDLSDYSTVGTSTYTTSLAPSLFFLKRVKRKYPHVRTVMGGGVFADDLALGSDNLDTLVAEYPFVDHVVLGEGEMLFLKLLEGELSHKRVISIADLEGKTLEMKDVPTPDFTDLDFEHYYHLTIEGARSCPFQCSFCSETIQWGDYRKKPIAQFVDQVAELARRHHNNAFFMGDSLMNPYIMQFAKELLDRGERIVYDGYLRADKPVTHRERLDVWARSGLYRVRLGIESASARVLDSMDKMTTPQVIADVLKALAGAGIRTTTYWIVGFAGETEDDFQQTCDFIRQNHRFIYEMEAHPYYYYPYGQIGSRLHTCHALYSDEVTDVIKFKVWEIDGADPTREQRYDRLRRISALARELGLPNIYKMSDRYQAEERWHALHPLAAEVYEGTHRRRKEAQAPARPLAVFDRRRDGAAAAGEAGREAVHAFHVSVGKRLDADKLREAAAQVVRFNETLRAEFGGGRHQSPGAERLPEDLLSVHAVEGAVEGGAQLELVAGELAASMRPEPGASMRVALIEGEGEGCDLLLLAHRAVADARSVGLFCEDLFRAYEQLSYGREVSLLPAPRSYADFLARAGNRPEPNLGAGAGVVSAGGPEAAGSVRVECGRELAEANSAGALADYGVRPLDVVLGACLETCSALAREGEASLTLALDCRGEDPDFGRTAGPLTTTRGLAEEEWRRAADPRAARRLLSGLSGPESGAAPPPAGAGGSRRLLLNLEYLSEEPWLGGDGWRPRGFVVCGGRPAAAYDFEVVPTEGPDGLRVYVNYAGGEESKEYAEALADGLRRNLRAAVGHCEGYARARGFWLGEFGAGLPASKVRAAGETGAAGDGGRATAACGVGDGLLERIAGACGAEPATVALAAYGLLLSRLNGSEDVLLISSVAAGSEPAIVPLRLSPAWDLSFRDFIKRTGLKTSLAHEHRAHAFEILSGGGTADESHPTPVFDAGYIFRAAGENGRAAAQVEETLYRFPSVSRGLDLILEVAGDGGGHDLRLNYSLAGLTREGVEELNACLRSIFEEAAEDPDRPLGKIAAGGAAAGPGLVEALSQDVFNF